MNLTCWLCDKNQDGIEYLLDLCSFKSFHICSKTQKSSPKGKLFMEIITRENATNFRL